MDTFAALNSILVKLFNDILNIEEKALITEEFKVCNHVMDTAYTASAVCG